MRNGLNWRHLVAPWLWVALWRKRKAERAICEPGRLYLGEQEITTWPRSN